MHKIFYLRRLSAVLLVCALPSLTSAQSIGLLELYQAALESDPVLGQAVAIRQAQEEAKPQARALLLPSLGTSASADQTFQDSSAPGTDDHFTSHNLAVNVTQSLYNRGIQVRQRLADTTVKQAASDYMSTEQELAFRVAQSYFNVLAARDDVIFVKADKTAIARQLEQAKERFEVGLVTITDVQEAQARFDQAVAEEIALLNTLADRKEALRELTGQYYDTLKPLQDNIPLQLPEPANAEAWIERALESNPNLHSAALAAELARENIDLARSEHYPSVDLTGSLSNSDSGNGSSNRARVGVQFSMPLYTGGRISSEVRESAYRHEAAKEQREQIQRAIVRQVQDAYRGAETAISRVKALDQVRVSSRSALEATQAGFDVGTRTIVDVLNAQRDLLRAERDYAQSRYAYILNSLLLEQSAGDLDQADIETVDDWLKE